MTVTTVPAMGDNQAPADAGLVARDISVLVGGRHLLADVAIEAPPGRITALLGPNGAGKSTLLRAVAGVSRPASGSVHLDGLDLLALGRRERARRVALVEQDATSELGVRVRDVVALGRTPHQGILGGGDPTGEDIVDAALERAGASDITHRELPTLSGGERQRVMLARALAQQPRLILLDEPTNHLDVAAQLQTLQVLESLAREGVTVVAALHELSLAAAFADQVVVLDRGRVIASGPTRTTLAPELIAAVYGVRAAWLENPLTGRPLLAVAPR